eukprot:scaffold21.g2134.t1
MGGSRPLPLKLGAAISALPRSCKWTAMLLDKLGWCSHDGPILSIHAQFSGLRFATGGVDAQVKVWSLPVALDARRELAEREGAGGDDPRPLAVLADHTAPVNVVRFSHNNRFLASGSDDKMACVFEHRAGPGGAVLGVDSPSAENWRTKLVLRGHANNVVDLDWSADDSRLATASIDNSVLVWEAASGAQLRRLDLHTSFVKGVAWDPVGTYLASQSEDKSVVIWRCDDWSVVATVRGPWSQMVSATFANRLSWSADGRHLLTGNSYQGATHAAVVLEREKWEDEDEHLLISGHAGAVVSGAFNPSLFSVPPGNGRKGGKDGAEGGGDGSDREAADGKEGGALMASVFALGSQDHNVSVWVSTSARPMVVGKKLFKSQVVDIAWTPDGYGLLACSSDGTVAVMQFEESELGKAATREELELVLANLYGAGRGKVGRKRLIPESAAQLAAEEEALSSPLADLLGHELGAPTAPAAALAAGSSAQQGKRPPDQPLQPSAKPNTFDAVAALDARLSGRMGRAGGETQLGFGSAAPAAGRATAGKKRAAPEPDASASQLMPPPPPRATASGRGAEVKCARVEPVPAGAPAQAAPLDAAAVASAKSAILRLPEPPGELTIPLGSLPSLFDEPQGGEAAGPTRELRVVNRLRGGPGGQAQADVQCSEGHTVKWTDSVRGLAVAACGTPNFAAVGTSDGQLLIYSRAGRRLTAPLKLGAGVARLACDDGWRLLALTTSGAVRLLDVGAMRALLTTSLVPLLEGGSAVLDLRLSRSGLPIVTLSNAYAYTWSRDLESWLCVADDSCATSQFAPMLRLGNPGELANLQADALRAALPTSGSGVAVAALLPASAAQQRQASRCHLEANLAGALALRSQQEYRRWLVAYVRFLTEHGEHDRLAEVCDSLLGAPQPSSGAGGGTALSDAAPSSGTWQPTVLGLSKWQLLRSDVLREVARNRHLSGLFSKYKDALAELEAAAVRQQQAAAAGAGQDGPPALPAPV